MRLDTAFIRAALSREGAQAWLPLIRVSHPNPAFETIRLVRHWAPLTHGGEVYQPAAFELSLPDETGVDEPQMVWAFDAVDREMVRRLRTWTTGLNVDVAFVLSDDPDTAGLAFSARMGRWEIEASSVRGTLTIEPILERAASVVTFDHARFPGLF